MSAHVVAYTEYPEDEVLTLKVVCSECDVEFGYGLDIPAANERLEALADHHNIERHGWHRVAY